MQVMYEYQYMMQEFGFDYKKYYKVRAALFKKMQSWGKFKVKLKIIKALFSKNTKIIATELEREDYGCDVGFIVSIK